MSLNALVKFICCFASSAFEFVQSKHQNKVKSPMQPFVKSNVLLDLSDLNNLQSKAYWVNSENVYSKNVILRKPGME